MCRLICVNRHSRGPWGTVIVRVVSAGQEIQRGSAKLAVARNPVNHSHFFNLQSPANLLWMALGILGFLFSLVYVAKNFRSAFIGDVGPSSENCTLFASPSGNDSNSGTSSASPKTFLGAAAATRPGSVVCLLGGSYNLSSSFKPPNSGSASSWIVYKNYDATPVNFVWTGAADAEPMFKVGNGSFPSGPAYIEFQGLNLNGSGTAADGFFCRGGHHARFIGNSISDTGGSGIGTINCDYLTADHNLINHNGYIPSSTSVPQYYSWTSAISFNSNQWFDNYSGFHNVISNNIISGQIDQSTHRTDGNGIILDLSSGSYNPATANTPPALVVNNVVFGNGGHCIVAYVVTNFWIVNNTCYENGLDPELRNAGSLTTSSSRNGFFINNIAVVEHEGQPPYEQQNSNENVLYYSNMYFGAPNNFAPSDPSQFIDADPLFVRPPALGSVLSDKQTRALPPPSFSLGNGLALLPSSPAIGKGTDPAALPQLPKNIVTDLKKYIYTDINGNRRLPGSGGFDLGAYQSGRQR